MITKSPRAVTTWGNTAGSEATGPDMAQHRRRCLHPSSHTKPAEIPVH